MKKILIFAIVLTLVLPTMTLPAVGERQFSDIEGHWAEQSIQELNKYGMISGYTDGTFRPDNTVSRAEIVAWITRILRYKMGDEMYLKRASERDVRLEVLHATPVMKDYYKDYKKLDIPEGYWAKQAIEEGRWLGILPYEGFEDYTAFIKKADYYKQIGRGEVAHCLTQAARWFPDEFPIPDHIFQAYIYGELKDIRNNDYYPSACEKAYLQGLFGGYPDKTFRPERPISRAEVAAVLLKLLEPQRAARFLPDEPTVTLVNVNYKPGEDLKMIQGEPQIMYPPYFPAEDQVIYEVLELSKVMDSSAGKVTNYESGGYQHFHYVPENGNVNIGFYDSYKDRSLGLNIPEYLEQTHLGYFGVFMYNLELKPKREDQIGYFGNLYKFSFNKHWDRFIENHWNTVTDITNFLLEDDADILLQKILDYSKKTSYPAIKEEIFDLNGRKIGWKEVYGKLEVYIQSK